MLETQECRLDEYIITDEPYFLPRADEIEVALAAHAHRLPLLLKGPTGCGKTRFMEYLAWRLKRPLITVSCHDDLSTSDLVGRYLIKGGGGMAGWTADLCRQSGGALLPG